jgi:hypothetical protein
MKTLLTLLILTATCNAQSLLTDSPMPEPQARAVRAQQNAQGLRNSVLGGLRHSITDLWSSDYQTNVETAAALGNNGAELYSLYQAFFTSIRQLLVAAGDNASVAELDSLAAKVPELTVNPDGTLTIIEPPAPEPESTPEPAE